ncbi:hypothetical protein [Streptomyces sp. cg36]|uniref:hypothetical protein n=1 Tax=Streptomyces sp. cg36 TaxID=3238798 RepID=UPI0034E1EA41
MAEKKEQAGGGSGVPGAPGPVPVAERTDFDTKSHQELWAMVQGMQGTSAKALADKLADAAKAITEIGDDLKTHMSRVVWQGEGAKAFTDWGHGAAMATLGLGQYSRGASTWLDLVAQAIANVKTTVPAYDPSLGQQAAETHKLYLSAHHDPDGQQEARDASAKLAGLNEKMEGQRQEAVRELRKLGDAYVQSGEQIALLQPPRFPPPPGAFVPPEDSRHGSVYVDGGRTSSGRRTRTSAAPTGGHALTSAVVEKGTEGSVTASHTPGASVGAPPAHVPDRPVGTEIDGVHTLPPAAQTAPTGPAVPSSPPTGRVEGGSPPIVVVPPAFGGAGKPRLQSPDVIGGRPSGNGGLRGPSLPGPSTVGGLPPSKLPPQEKGIVGGRPVPPTAGRPAGGIPRGTVVGNEGPQARPPMAHGPAGGMGGVGGRGAVVGGRRLAGEPGGVVGGRPTAGGARSGRPFTEGGSGLVRNGEGGTQAARAGRGGMVPPAPRGAAGRRDEREGERPDYLVEDEETWQRSDRRIVPPVID